MERLLEVMRTLRGPEGCPWDREQTHASLRPYNNNFLFNYKTLMRFWSGNRDTDSHNARPDWRSEQPFTLD